MPTKTKLLAFTGAFMLLAPEADVFQTTSTAEINIMIIPFIAHLLAIIGSLYLAAQLYMFAEKASATWKYLSLSAVLFSLWNTIMAFNIILKVLSKESAAFAQSSYGMIYSIKTIDPVLEVIVFFLFYYGMKRVANTMHNKPWTVFSKEDSNE